MSLSEKKKHDAGTVFTVSYNICFKKSGIGRKQTQMHTHSHPIFGVPSNRLITLPAYGERN